MSIRRSSIGLIGVAVIVLLTGCAQAPTEKLEALEQAIAGATSAEAERYAPDAWADLSDKQARLEAELQAQQDKLAVFRSYDEVAKLAEEASLAAAAAGEAAMVAREQARTEASALIAEAKVKLEELNDMIKGAPRGKGTQADLAVLKNDASQLGLTIDAGEQSYDAGDYLTAKVKAEAALSSIEEIRSEIESAKRMSGRTAS